MAKTLSEKGRLIRHAIVSHPDMGNKEIAALLNSSAARQQDGIEVKASDVASHRQRMKKPGAGEEEPEEEDQAQVSQPAARMTRRPAPAEQPAPAPQASVVDLIERVFALARDCGGFSDLKRLVDRLAEMERGD